jgi:hypothetical protein
LHVRKLLPLACVMTHRPPRSCRHPTED